MRGQLFTLPQGNYRIQAVKAQCEIRSLEKQLHLAHMRADLEAEESLRRTHSEVIQISHFFAEKMPNCGGGEETQERDFRAEDQNIHHHKGGPVLSN